MPFHRAAESRRLIRRRRHASPWQQALACLSLVRVHPRRAPLHGLALSVGLAAALVSTLVGRPAVSPATESVPPVEIGQPAPELEVQPITMLPSPDAQAAPNLTTYVVEPGDTLKSLADRFGVSVATIAAANRLSDPDMIRVGQELVLLPTDGVLHSVSPGETLGQVAQRYGVDAAQVATVNQVAPAPDQPVPGEKLVVPGVEPPLPKAEAGPKTSVAQTAAGDKPPTAGRETSFASLTLTAESDSAAPDSSDAKQLSVAEAPEKPAPAKPVAQAKSPLMYQVQDGDTVVSLANQFGVSIKTILSANNLDDPDLITPGTKLKVLPVSGVEHEVGKGESLADIAAAYKVDMGPIIDFNGLADPDLLNVGDKVVIPGASARVAVPTAAQVSPRVAPSAPSSAVAAIAAPQPAAQGTIAAPKPAAQLASTTVQSAGSVAQSTGSAAQPASSAAIKPAVQAAAPAITAPAITAPAPVAGAGAGGIVKIAMSYLGSRYVFGGASPAGFDCSGFVWYVHKMAGLSDSRGLWGQMNAGQRVTRENLQPGDTVFFANTYMPGLSHAGIYVGGGSFIHAIDESQGVGISSLNGGYWAGRYVGASRLR
jgi:cell wall-associated NlpC family hydrolase